ncbi:flagellar biosynthetic protein FliO [Roseateles microcysteis]|uniref:flagellar biosynthetic protein FliO n=1 Tax=Roseateles microcysteis TaxID=3119057 RepID=UPI002FE66981
MSKVTAAAAASHPLGQAQAIAPIPFKTDAASAGPSGQQWGLALVLCMTLLAAAMLLLKRRGGRAFRWEGRSPLLNVLESRAIGGQSQLVVASYAGRLLLICTGPGGTSCLRDDPDSEALARDVGSDRP